jgi:hypothetical protein
MRVIEDTTYLLVRKEYEYTAEPRKFEMTRDKPQITGPRGFFDQSGLAAWLKY